ncbi:MAG: S41 family peptidase [Treponema sp.]|nr:S41 family peptidase [Treponema sp.]
MSDNGFPAENRPPRRKIPVSWIWIASTALLCAVFAFASVPGVLAQVRDSAQAAGQAAGQAENAQRNRKYTAVIQQVFDFIQRHYVEEVDSKVIFEGAMTGIFNALDDPYSAFLPESEMKDLNDTTQGSFGGVGLYITKPVGNKPDGQLPFVEVASPIEDTPGWRAGINPGDLIISIDGEYTDKLSLDEVLGRLRGPPGVVINLVIRRGEKLEFPVSLTRAVIEVPTAKHAMVGSIGYLKLLTFTPFTADRAAEAILDFRAKNYTGVILDLRNNYGGLLNSAVDVSSLFLESGVVVSTKSRIASENQVFRTRRQALVPSNIPVVVLINRGSASASEIVAGALKDRGRAYLIGENSYGKGSVQQVYPLEAAGFKITTARYYTPSDANIDKAGIPPDRKVSFPEFTDADSEKLGRLINDNKLPSFVNDNPQAGAAQIEAFAKSLEKEYGLDLTLLKRLIRNEQNRTAIAPVYDLEYDVQLQEAVNVINSGSFRSLMQTTKTLKALQEEAAGDLAQAS